MMLSNEKQRITGETISTRNLDGRGVPYQYARFLNTLPWSHFATFTTRESIGRFATRRLIQKISKKIPIRSSQSNVKIFWAAEQFKSKDGYHIHCLINCPLPGHIAELKSWYENNHGFCKILPKNGRASDYVVKNISHVLNDYDLL